MVKNVPENEMLKFLKELEVDETVLKNSLEPKTCRHCGFLLTPEIVQGRIRYGCYDCDD